MKPIFRPIIVLSAAAGLFGASPVSFPQFGPAASVTGIVWRPVAPLIQSRYYHTATLLPSGKLLVTGGRCLSAAHLRSCELFDPVGDGGQGSWTAVQPMSTPRDHHAATLLPSGLVLVTAGWNDADLTSCEAFNPFFGGWVAVEGMHCARSEHTATLLPGNRVLVVGGKAAMQGFRGCEIFEYRDVRGAGDAAEAVASGTWRIVDSLSIGRGKHTATLLLDGRLIVTGGVSQGYATSTCEIFDPGTETWSAAPSMHEPREGHTATLLPDGTVLVAGGDNPERSSCELFDPAAAGGTGAWVQVAPMSLGRRLHRALLSHDGIVLVTGAWATGWGSEACELFDGTAPLISAWKPAAPMLSKRCNHTLTMLPDGRILAAGGEIQGAQGATDACEIGSFETTQDASIPLPPPPAGLRSVFPDPARESMTAEYAVRSPGRVELNVYDPRGRKVKTLVDAWQGEGMYS
ncbi:MAG: hypothetical protein QHI48_06525, partial [Bacteroidota bacterium]|nr:hypothetical protein [Bacteroidota bacterium]